MANMHPVEAAILTARALDHWLPLLSHDVADRFTDAVEESFTGLDGFESVLVRHLDREMDAAEAASRGDLTHVLHCERAAAQDWLRIMRESLAAIVPNRLLGED